QLPDDDEPREMLSCKFIVMPGMEILETGASEGSLERRHHLSSWLISRISMPGITMNLQLSISRGSSSSGSWQVTRQYWQSWFQQKRPYGTVSGLMNWKHRKSEFRSGT